MTDESKSSCAMLSTYVIALIVLMLMLMLTLMLMLMLRSDLELFVPRPPVAPNAKIGEDRAFQSAEHCVRNFGMCPRLNLRCGMNSAIEPCV